MLNTSKNMVDILVTKTINTQCISWYIMYLDTII